jgi:hypothetical protein
MRWLVHYYAMRLMNNVERWQSNSVKAVASNAVLFGGLAELRRTTSLHSRTAGAGVARLDLSGLTT